MIQNISRETVFKALIILIAVVCFSPCLTAEFVNWDDNKFIYKNDIVTDFPWHDPIGGLRVVFSQVLIGMYTPLTVLTFILEEAIWGLDSPGLWHLDNIILHSISIILVFGICRKLKFDAIYAGLITLLFAIHPLRVESVAWVTERKDVLYGVFFFSAIWYYLKLAESEAKQKLHHFLIWVFFILALLTKVLAVTIPVVFVLLDILRNKDFKWNYIWGKWPLFLTSFGFGVLGVYLVGLDPEVVKNTTTLPFLNKVILTGHVLTVYIGKLFLPYEMMPIYPFPSGLSLYHFLSSVSLLIIPLSALYAFFKKHYKIFFGLAFFLVNVMFTLPINAIGQGYMSDRFSYISFLGLFMLLAWGIQEILKRNNHLKPLLRGITGIFIIGFCYQTYSQSQVWQNSEILWIHQIQYTPEIKEAYISRSNYYKSVGRRQEALTDLERALAINPNWSNTHNLKAQLLVEEPNNNNLELALYHYNQAIALDTSYAAYFVNRAVVNGKLNRYNEALEDLDIAIEKDKTNPDAFLNRAVILRDLNRFQACLNDLDSYLELVPDKSDIWVIRGQILSNLNRIPEGIESINNAIHFNPNRGLYYFERAILYANLNQYENAKSDIEISRNLGYNQRQEKAIEILNR